MQAPIIIFDHIKKTVTTVPAAPRVDDKNAAALLAAQRDQVSTASGIPPRR